MPSALIERSARSGLAAAAEALFPENDYGAPDHRTTELVSRTWSYMGELPRSQRRLLVSLFVVVELGAPVLTLSFRRFSRMPVARREETVRAWRRSRVLPLRILGDALKATLTLLYMSHPAALSHIGAHSTCERPLDPLQLPTRRDALGAPR